MKRLAKYAENMRPSYSLTSLNGESMSVNNRKLCLGLLYAESEQAVISLLKHCGYWYDDTAWRLYGDIENNWSQIGNQQSHPVAAMVEKLVNSIDAVLMRECLQRGIPVEGFDAPQSIKEAQEAFFGIRNGNLANIGAINRTQLAQNIGLVATGSKNNPNYTVFDRGEGQTPRSMPDTLLSLSKANKLRIPFVQGKFNMGGTGALPYCGEDNLQLVISRRCPEIADPDDPTSSHWGFTVVRRQNPPEGARSSIFTYLAPNNEILSFDSADLRLPRGHQDISQVPKMEWGTAIKMFEYKMTGYRTNIKLDLYYAISLALPRPGLPVRFYEFRNYRQANPEATMAGLHVRLQDDRNENVEKGFPRSHQMRVMGESMRLTLYAFKEGRDKNYRSDQGIIFTINGQIHGAFSKSFFSRHNVKMSYIAHSILGIVDATDISARAREDLTLNNRERLRRNELYTAIERKLEEIIRNDAALKALREQRKNEYLQDKLSDSKPIKEVLNNIIKNSPSLAALFITGEDLSSPFKPRDVDTDKDEFIGKQHPEFFRLFKKYRKPRLNERPINRRQFRMQFETDAVDDYFDREIDPGIFELRCDDSEARDYSLNLRDGVATLNIGMPHNTKVGDRLTYFARVSDELLFEPFVNEFEILVTKVAPDSPGGGGGRLPPTGDGDGDREKPDSMAMPEIVEVRRAEWKRYDFHEYSALDVKGSGAEDDAYIFFVNLDNIYLNTELKAQNVELKLMQERFKYAMVLIGLAILKDATENQVSHFDEERLSPEESVAKYTSIIAPVILPMIQTLGDLDINEP